MFSQMAELLDYCLLICATVARVSSGCLGPQGSDTLMAGSVSLWPGSPVGTWKAPSFLAQNHKHRPIHAKLLGSHDWLDGKSGWWPSCLTHQPPIKPP